MPVLEHAHETVYEKDMVGSNDLNFPLTMAPRDRFISGKMVSVSVIKNYPGANFVVDGSDIIGNIVTTLFIIRILEEHRMPFNIGFADGNFYIFSMSKEYGGKGIFENLRIGISELFGYFMVDGRSCSEPGEDAIRVRMEQEFNSIDGAMYEGILEDVLYKTEVVNFIAQHLITLNNLFDKIDDMPVEVKEKILTMAGSLLADGRVSIADCINSMQNLSNPDFLDRLDSSHRQPLYSL